MILYFLLGILFWQVVTMIIFMITNQSEEKGVICGSLLPFGIVWGFCKVIRTILDFIKNYKVRAVLVCPDGKWRCCKSKNAMFLQYTGYNFPTWTNELKQKYPVSLWKEQKIKDNYSFDVGNLRYSPKKVWQGLEEISKNEIELAKQEYKRQEKE